jgi:hypothetical protein
MLMGETAKAAMTAHGVRRMPFIWFWPEGAPSCTMMTHDVEGAHGMAFCEALMDLDQSLGVPSAFQLVPETPGGSSRLLAERIRQRGFEVNIHDWNHDGYLFHDRERFLKRVADINRHAREFGCDGFRSGSMYREQRWFDAFELSYDMSVPNAAHLEPQRGGCCTVMPYFVGDVLELPLTTTQDYTLFHILHDYSIELWKREIDLIRSSHGLISFIAHPDYLIDAHARGVYEELLGHLSALRAAGQTWMATPGDVNRWWRSRHQMQLVADGGSWRVVGPDSNRARVAYLTADGDRIAYELEPETQTV